MFASAFLYAAIWLHPFYITMTDIVYRSTSKSVQVSVRIFTDDFEKALRKNCHCKVDLSSKDNTAAMNPLVQQYILQHLKIKLNGHGAMLVYKGYQPEGESTWNYFEVSAINKFRRVHIVNTLLHDYKDEQISMVHVTANGNEQTNKLNFPESELDFNF